MLENKVPYFSHQTFEIPHGVPFEIIMEQSVDIGILSNTDPTCMAESIRRNFEMGFAERISPFITFEYIDDPVTLSRVFRATLKIVPR